MTNRLPAKPKPALIVEMGAILLALGAAGHVFWSMPPIVLVIVVAFSVPFLSEFSTTMARRYHPDMEPSETFRRLMPASTCDLCAEPLGARAFPFIQVLIGRGRCKCGKLELDQSYSRQAFALTLGVGCLLFAAFHLDGVEQAARIAVVALACIPLVIMDYEHKEVDEAMVVVSVVVAVLLGGKMMAWQPAVVLMVGFVMAGFLASIIRGEVAMGFMDIVAAGLFGAFLSLQQVLAAFGLSALVLGAVVGGQVLISLKRREEVDLDRSWPFIPAIAGGALLAMLLPPVV